MANPMLDRWARTSNLTKSHKRSGKQERELAKRTGGRLTPASGSGVVKGDVRVKGKIRIEAKTTKHKSFAVSLAMFQRLEESALSTGEMPVIVVEFITPDGKPIAELAVVPTYVLDGLVQP